MAERSEPESRALGFEPALDGIRAVAVLVVVLFHYSSNIVATPFTWIASGHIGVDVFFVLSGFLITALMLGEHRRSGGISFRGFYRRRAYRLLPALVVFLAAQFVFFILIRDSYPVSFLQPRAGLKDEVVSVLAVLFFVVNWLSLLPQFHLVLGLVHLWSLSVEEQFYLVWPAVMVLMLSRRRAANRAASILVAGLIAFTTLRYWWGAQPVVARGLLTVATFAAVLGVLALLGRQGRRWWTVGVLVGLIAAVVIYRNGSFTGGLDWIDLYDGTLGRADSLVIGALLAYLWMRCGIPRRGPVWLALLGWAFLIWVATHRVLPEPFFFRYGWDLIALAAALAIWGSLGAAETRYGKVLSWSPLRAIGKVSFGLYLWHVLVFIAVDQWMPKDAVVLRTVVALGVTAAVVTASYFLVEKPMIARKNRRGRPSESSASIAAS